jgi:hypothetical protein
MPVGAGIDLRHLIGTSQYGLCRVSAGTYLAWDKFIELWELSWLRQRPSTSRNLPQFARSIRRHPSREYLMLPRLGLDSHRR